MVIDGGQKVLICSMCGSQLVTIWITDPHAEFDWDIVAECCYCGDKSFPIQVHGRFHVGTVVQELVSNHDTGEYHEIVKTSWSNFHVKDNRVYIQTTKGF